MPAKLVATAIGCTMLMTACYVYASSDKSNQTELPASVAVEISKPVSNTAAPDKLALKLPRFIDFGSKQCKACKAMEPVLEALAKNHADKFTTEFVDVWVSENKDLAMSHGIQSIPTQVFLDSENKEVFRNTGFFSEEDVLAKWTELGLLKASNASATSSSPEAATPVNASETAKGE